MTNHLIEFKRLCKIIVDIEQVETVYQGYFRVYKYLLKHSLYQGCMSQFLPREVFERDHIGAVLLYDLKKECLLMIEQFRPAHKPQAGSHGFWNV